MGVYCYDMAPLPPDEQRRERAVLQSGALAASGDPALQWIVDEACHTLGTTMGAISIIFRDWQYLLVTHGLAPGPTRRSHAFCAHAIMRPQSLFLIPDAARDLRFADNPNVTDAPGIRFYAGRPLLDRDGVALGMLCVFDPMPRHGFGAAEDATLRALADRAVAAIAARGSRPAPA